MHELCMDTVLSQGQGKTNPDFLALPLCDLVAR